MIEIEINWRRGGSIIQKFDDLRDLASWVSENPDALNNEAVHRWDIRQVSWCSKHNWEFVDTPTGSLRLACQDCDAKIAVHRDAIDSLWHQKSEGNKGKF